jgi:hypothetical protein
MSSNGDRGEYARMDLYDDHSILLTALTGKNLLELAFPGDAFNLVLTKGEANELAYYLNHWSKA